MNLRGGMTLIRKSLFSFMASRGFFWTLSVSWMMGPLVFLFVWLAAAGNGDVNGLDRSVFIPYYLVLILVNQLTYPTSHWIIGENIQLGTLSTWLMRPLPIIYEAIASDIALKVVCMPVVLVITGTMAVFLFTGISVSFFHIAFFAASIIMAAILRFYLAYGLSLLAFWTQKIDSVLSIHDTLIFLLAGQVAPTVLLPGILRTASIWLPFRYMLGFPVEILTGMLHREEMIYGLVLQLSWMPLAILMQKLVYRAGIKNYTAVGG